MPNTLTAQSAIEIQRRTTSGRVVGRATNFVCPHSDCGTYAVHHWGFVGDVGVMVTEGSISNRMMGDIPEITFSFCEACRKECIFIGGTLVLPAQSDAPAPAVDMPSDIVADYEEARAIVLASPRGAAALLRLVIQKLLPHLGATKTVIDAAIGELVAAGKIKTPIQRALDTVRVIGNESVHPGEMNFKDDRETAIALFRIVNLIVETEITEPKRLEEIYASLPQSKLDGIAQRDALAKTSS